MEKLIQTLEESAEIPDSVGKALDSGWSSFAYTDSEAKRAARTTTITLAAMDTPSLLHKTGTEYPHGG